MTENIMAGASGNIVLPECIICLSSLSSDLVTSVNCGHVFHSDCLRNWHNKNNQDFCPLCKRDSSHILRLIYDIKYETEDPTDKDPQTMFELINQNKLLKKKISRYELEITDLTEYKNKCQKQVDEFITKVEENIKNMQKYKNEYLNIKYELNQEKEKNQKYLEKIEIIEKEKEKLENFKQRYEIKNEIEEETEKIISNKNKEKIRDDFDKQFYKLLNDDDEKKGLREYFYVLQQRILNLTEENEELKKFKKNYLEKEKYNFGFNNGTTYTQFLQLSENNNKRNYNDFIKGKKITENKNKINIFNFEEKNNSIVNNNNIKIKDSWENKIQVNEIKLKKNNENNGLEFRKLFNNPLRKKELTFKKK